MTGFDYDVAVIGGGTGGLVAATRCAAHGLRTALVERDRLGGECLWTGCVPTKALLHSAELHRLMARADEFGLASCRQPLSWPGVVRAKDEIVARISRHDSPEAMARAGVSVLPGVARLRSEHEVVVNGRVLSARNLVIATGSRQGDPAHIDGLRDIGYITHVEAVHLPALPDAIAVIGAGPVGVEFAQLFARLGARVSLLERTQRILAKEDPEVADLLERVFEAEGIGIHHHCSEKRVDGGGAGKTLRAELGGVPVELKVDEIMLATGRVPNVEDLGLERIGVRTGPRGIAVDEWMRSSVPNVYACGDVAGEYLFTHVAEHQGTVVAHNLAFPGEPRRVDYRVVPWVTFTDPEVGHVGLTEPEARRAGRDVEIARYSFAGSDRAVIMRQAEGFVKVIADATSGEILGAHIVGPDAGSLIHEYALAMRLKAPLPAIAETIHAYPTLSEAVRWAATNFGRTRP